MPGIKTEFLPRALGHVASHFRIAPARPVVAVSVTALSFATACWLMRVAGAATPAQAAGFALLAAITALALAEHWLMLLPLPDAKLWRWMLPAPGRSPKRTRTEGHHGF
ncbi:MAG: DUF3623 family protein [Roseovarius sp.]|nr:DUF3623 family protein [Roseovarius sp.]